MLSSEKNTGNYFNRFFNLTFLHPTDTVNLILFGKATYKKMIQNLIWATGYNVVALPLAAGVLYNQELLLSPAAGAPLMTISTVVVAINASLLKVKKLK